MIKLRLPIPTPSAERLKPKHFILHTITFAGDGRGKKFALPDPLDELYLNWDGPWPLPNHPGGPVIMDHGWLFYIEFSNESGSRTEKIRIIPEKVEEPEDGRNEEEHQRS